jgi:CRP-like cAMP-binding protein
MTPQELLRLHPFFAGLPERDLQRLLGQSISRRLGAGKVLFGKDDPGDGLYGVLSGRIAFTVDSPEGKKFILNELGVGEFFGEIALLDGKGRSAGAMAREASRLLFVPRQAFLSFVRERPEMLLHIVGVVCARLRRSTEYIADAAFLDLGRRLAKQLVSLADTAGEVRVSHADLAAMLGASRERVSRQLAAWRAQRLLEQRRGRLVLRNAGALEKVASGAG